MMSKEEMKRLDELKPCTEERAKDIAKEEFEPYAKQIRGLQYLKLEVEKLVSDWEKITELSPHNPYTATTLEYLKFFLSEIERVMDGSLADDYERVEKFMNEGGKEMKEYMTVEELKDVEKQNYNEKEVNTIQNPINRNDEGYQTSSTYTITKDSACGNRLPCGVCLLTNKKCPLFVETEGITIGDPPYPYSPFTWCINTQDTNTSGYKKDGVETKAYNED